MYLIINGIKLPRPLLYHETTKEIIYLYMSDVDWNIRANSEDKILFELEDNGWIFHTENVEIRPEDGRVIYGNLELWQRFMPIQLNYYIDTPHFVFPKYSQEIES